MNYLIFFIISCATNNTSLAEHYPIDKALNKIDPITLKDKIIEKSKRFLFKTGLITVARHLNKGKKVEVVENK